VGGVYFAPFITISRKSLSKRWDSASVEAVAGRSLGDLYLHFVYDNMIYKPAKLNSPRGLRAARIGGIAVANGSRSRGSVAWVERSETREIADPPYIPGYEERRPRL